MGEEKIERRGRRGMRERQEFGKGRQEIEEGRRKGNQK